MFKQAFNQIKSTVSSREFQTGAGQVAIAVVTMVASSVVSHVIAKGLNTGLEGLMDKIHGEIVENVETPAE